MTELQEIFMQARGIPMYVVFLSLLLILFAVLVVKEFLETRKQDDAPVSEKKKCKGYLQSIGILWGMVLVVFIMCFIGGISLEEIGFRKISFNYGFWFNVVTLVASGLFLAYVLSGIISLFLKKETAEMPSSVMKYLPRTKKEKWLFSCVALSAGVCEEIIFRGFLLFLIIAIFPDMPTYLVILIPTALFGIGHLYQGLKGIMGTALLGAFFICLYLVTDSLIIPMFLHFLNDLLATFVLSEKDEAQKVSTTE